MFNRIMQIKYFKLEENGQFVELILTNAKKHYSKNKGVKLAG